MAMFEDWKVLEVGRGPVDDFVRRHYLHRWPGVVVCVLALLDKSSVIGCVIFALPPRETMRRYEVTLAWELARLFIEDDTPKNAETWFVSRAIKWIKKNRPDVKALVSYADPSVGHQGIIYQAGNWIKDGRTDQERKTPRFDYENPETGKHYSRKGHVPEGVTPKRVPRVSKFRYVYWLDGSHEKRRKATLQEQNKRISDTALELLNHGPESAHSGKQNTADKSELLPTQLPKGDL